MSTIYELPEELVEEYTKHKKPIKITSEIEALGKYAHLPTLTVEVAETISECKNGASFMSVLDLADYIIHYPNIGNCVLKFVDRALKNVDYLAKVVDAVYRAGAAPVAYTYFFRLAEFSEDALWVFTALRWANLVLSAVHSFEELSQKELSNLARKMWELSRRFKVQYIFIVPQVKSLKVLKLLPNTLDNVAYMAGGFASDSELYIYVLSEVFEDGEVVYELGKLYRGLSTKFRHVAVDTLR